MLVLVIHYYIMGFGGKDIKNNSKYKIMKIKILLF